jgi:hypothetical protein
VLPLALRSALFEAVMLGSGRSTRSTADRRINLRIAFPEMTIEMSDHPALLPRWDRGAEFLHIRKMMPIHRDMDRGRGAN